jgi:hypothetical protein
MIDTDTETPIADAPASVEPSFDERISAQLIARGRLKEADLVRARRLQEQNPEGGLSGAADAPGPGVGTRPRRGLRGRIEAAAARSAKDVPELPPPRTCSWAIRFLKQFHVVPVGEDAIPRHVLRGRSAGSVSVLTRCAWPPARASRGRRWRCAARSTI